MELITNKLDDMRLVIAKYEGIEIPLYVDKDSENVFIDFADLPILFSSLPENTDFKTWSNVKKAVIQTLTNQFNS